MAIALLLAGVGVAAYLTIGADAAKEALGQLKDALSGFSVK